MKKFLSFFLLSFSFLFGMEFGQMGSQSFGMAGTGVSLKNNHFALYYNPSLLANTTDDFTMQVYGNLTTKNNNFNKIFSVDLSNPSKEDKLKIEEVLKNNGLFVGSQIGAVVAFNNYTTGGFGVGAFLTTQTFGSITADIKGKELRAEYTNLLLLEIPVGYAYEFVTDGGDISVGITAKFMSLSRNGGYMNINNSTNMSDSIKDFINFDMNNKDYNYGIDVGISYEPFEWWNIAVVAKNLNVPKFNIAGHEYQIDPQFRAGTSFTWDFFTLAFDADIVPNEYMYNVKEKEQMISLGTSFDFDWVAVRAGVAYDLKHTDDLIYALGVSITVLDIGLQFGHKTNPISGVQIPDYVSLQCGIGFTF